MRWIRDIDLNDLLKVVLLMFALSATAQTVYLIVTGR